MAYLHDEGIFHGDLKASNVLVNHRDGHIDAKITDFGVSQKIQLDYRGDASSSDGLSDDANSGPIRLSLIDPILYSDDANSGESSLFIPPIGSIPSYLREPRFYTDSSSGESSLSIQRSLSATSSMYSQNSFSKVVGTTGWMAPEVIGTQVSIKTKHTVGLFLEVDLGVS